MDKKEWAALAKRGLNMKIKKDRLWNEYPIGAKAHVYNGGHWTKTENGACYLLKET